MCGGADGGDGKAGLWGVIGGTTLLLKVATGKDMLFFFFFGGSTWD